MKIESKKDKAQIIVFMLIYALTCLTCYGNWFQLSYLVNNVILLVISAVPIFVDENPKVYYMFSYACAISSWIDSFVIPFSLFFEHRETYGIMRQISFITAVLTAIVFMVLKFVICISEVQVARHLTGQPELKFRYKLDLFNYARGNGRGGHYQRTSTVADKNGSRSKDVVVNLSQITANTTQVNQTSELIGQTINQELKFEKNPELEKHLVPR